MRKYAFAIGSAALTAACAGTALGQQLTTVPIVSGFTRPVLMLAPPGDKDRLFVLEQRGSAGLATRADIRIINLHTNTINPTPFLSISPVSTGSEQGLLGMAFDPNYASNGFFYINYTNSSGTTVVARYHVSADPNVADPASATTVITIAQPFSNHNGGCITFGPDGFFYIGMGDGGNEGDPNLMGQNLNTLLSKILRIDVSTLPYQVPTTNPFVGNPNARPEIWAYGVRNPWRFTFDRLTGAMMMGDVGQDTWEEIDYQPRLFDPPFPAENYGWSCYEGYVAYHTTNCPDISTTHLPIYVYHHSGTGCTGSITGGYVYRGCTMPWLRGEYFFADYCMRTISSFRYSGTGNVSSVTNRTTELQPPAGPAITSVTSFGEDDNGELYLCSGTTVYRVAPRCLANCDGSTSSPSLNISDFICFQTAFAANDCYANCDGSTTPPVLNVNDFICFQAAFVAATCP